MKAQVKRGADQSFGDLFTPAKLQLHKKTKHGVAVELVLPPSAAEPEWEMGSILYSTPDKA